MNYLDLVLSAKADPSSKTYFKDLALETRATDPTDIKTKITCALKSRGFLGNTDGVAAYIASKRAADVAQPGASFDYSDIAAGLADFPDGIDDAKLPFKMDFKRVAILSDLHIGLHDKRAIMIALEGAKRFGADCIYFNGDLADTYSVSSHSKIPGRLSLKTEIELVKQFLGFTRELFPKTEIVWKMGNHCDRLERFVMSKCPELAEILGGGMFQLCEAKDFGIKEVTSSQIATLGDLTIVHGHESYLIGGGATPARATRMKSGNLNTVQGHNHRISSDIFRDLHGKITRTYSTGCLCKLSPDYVKAGANWQHGYALVERDGMDFELQNLEIR